MKRPCLNDKDEFPDNEVLSRYLGNVKEIWDSFLEFLNQEHPSFTGEWRYYNDGKSWLYKLTKKKKTISWISVWDNMFKTSFYFPDKAEDLIVNINLKKEYIDKFVNGNKYSKTRGLTVEIKKPTDLATTKKLIELKEQLK